MVNRNATQRLLGKERDSTNLHSTLPQDMPIVSAIDEKHDYLQHYWHIESCGTWMEAYMDFCVTKKKRKRL